MILHFRSLKEFRREKEGNGGMYQIMGIGMNSKEIWSTVSGLLHNKKYYISQHVYINICINYLNHHHTITGVNSVRQSVRPSVRPAVRPPDSASRLYHKSGCGL